jgi:hypothetical protein
LIDVGLAEYVEPQFLRFDPALLGLDLAADERSAATANVGGSDGSGDPDSLHRLRYTTRTLRTT